VSISPADLLLDLSPPPRLRDAATRRAFLDSYIEHFNERVTDLAIQLRSGKIGIEAWQLAMRNELRDLHRSALILSRGGERGAITFSEWGRLGAYIRGQYNYLYNYAQQLQQNAMAELSGLGKFPSEKYLAWRSKLYGGNARASFYRGMAMGLLEQVPGDGQTICKCVTTPESRVLTRRGLIPIACVIPGDFVWTHRNRWRLVMDVSVKPSSPFHYQAWMSAPGWKQVGLTSDHRLWTVDGWRTIVDVDRQSLKVGVLDYGLTDMCVRSQNQEPDREMFGMPIDLSLWQAQGLPGGGMHLLCHEPESKKAMGESKAACFSSGRDTESGSKAPPALRGSNGEILLSKTGWTDDRLLSGQIRQETLYLPLSVEVGACKWANTGGPCAASQERGLYRRQIRESRVDGASPTCAIAWAGSQGPQFEANLDMPELRKGVSELSQGWRRSEILFDRMLPSVDACATQDLSSVWGGIPAYQWRAIDILFEGMLSPGSPLYDIEVDQDHSFIVEGVVVHNSNCRCELRFEEGDYPGLMLVFWQIHPEAENCDDCIALSQEWNPRELWLPVGISARDWVTWLPRMKAHPPVSA
jgi:hypothetical protein